MQLGMPHAPVYGLVDSGALQRSRRRDLWPRLLDPRRPLAAAAADAAVMASRAHLFRIRARVSLPRHRRQRLDRTTIRRRARIRTYGARDQLLARVGAAARADDRRSSTPAGKTRAHDRRHDDAPASIASYWDLRKRVDEDAAHAHEADVRCRVQDGRATARARRRASERSRC